MLSFLKKMYKISTSSSLKFQVKKIQENWQPLIKELKEMAETVQNQYKQLAAEKKGETKIEPTKFVKNIQEVLDQIAKLPMSVDYELYHAADEKTAKEFLNKNKNAIVIVQENKNQYTYIKNLSGEIVKKSTNESIKLPTPTSLPKKVMLTTEENFNKIDKLVKSMLENANIKQPDTDWDAMKELLEKIPDLVAAFDELNLHSKLQNQLSELKKKLDPQKIIKDLLFTGYDLAPTPDMPAELKPQTIYLGINTNKTGLNYQVIGQDNILKKGIILWKDLPKDFPKNEKEILSSKKSFLPDILQKTSEARQTPSPTLYQKIIKEMDNWLDDKNFSKLSPDEKAMTLSFMELHYQALKQIYLQLNAVEQKIGLISGSLANVKIIEDKSFNQLCEEFSKVYEHSMGKAGYKTSVPLYPFTVPAKDSSLSTNSQADTKASQASEVRTIEDLYTFTEKILGEQYQRLKNLKANMAAHTDQEQKSVQSNATIQNMTAKAKEFLATAEEKLKQALDENIYTRYFVESSLDRFYEKEQQKYWIKQGGEWVEKDKQGFIQDTGYAFIQLKKIIAKMEELQQPVPENQAETPAAHLANRAAKWNELVKAGTELATSLNQMKNDPYLRKLITIPDFPNTQDLLKKLSEEDTFSTFQNSIKESIGSLASIMETIKKELPLKLKNSEGQLLLRESVFETLTAVSELTGQLTKLAATKKVVGEEVNLLTFSIKNFSKISAILTKLPQVIELFSQLSKGEIISTAEKINDIMKQLVLLGDKLEIQLGLKEGYLTRQLEPAISAFNNKILELGYRFPEEKTYPYQEAMKKQRNSLLEGQEISPLQKELVKQRLSLTQGKAIKPEEKNPLSQEEKNQPIINEINEYIKNLNSLNQKELTKTIELLESLIKEKNASSFDLAQSWKQLKVDHPRHFSLLLKGETGLLLKKLEYKAQNISQDAIFNSLQGELAALKKQRGSYFTSSAQLLEEKISAWENLQDLLKTHNLPDALDKLTPSQLVILKKNEHGLLEKIQTMNSALNVEARLTTLINSSPSKPDAPAPASAPEEKKEDIIKIIDKQLAKLATDDRRAILLVELKGKLKINLSLDAAIKQMKSKHPDVHLLFQGRTGQMMKSIEYVTLTKEALIKRIDYELDILLHKQHSSHFVFFAQRRTATLEQHIKSLNDLKTALNESKGKTAREAIAELSDNTKKILQLHEPDLLKMIDAESPKKNMTLRQ